MDWKECITGKLFNADDSWLFYDGGQNNVSNNCLLIHFQKVHLDWIDPDVFEAILRYIYTGQVFYITMKTYMVKLYIQIYILSRTMIPWKYVKQVLFLFRYWNHIRSMMKISIFCLEYSWQLTCFKWLILKLLSYNVYQSAVHQITVCHYIC